MLNKTHPFYAAIFCLLWGLPVMADETAQQHGVIRDVDLKQGWVIIDTHRVRITANTRINNRGIGRHHPRALQTGRTVSFITSPNHELLSITVYAQSSTRFGRTDKKQREIMP